MPRPERVLDPDSDPLQRFAHGLRELRRGAGRPGYRELAETTRFSASALAAAARGERLPSLQVTLAYVEACGGDRERWKREWEKLRQELSSAPENGADADPPYLGLSPYGTEDAGRFFGRAALVDEIVARVQRDDFVAVFGPSGSGKSSLLRAGVVPVLDKDAAVVTPGDGNSLPGSGLLVIDQFEEVFTLRREAADRSAFIDAVLARPGKTVIAVRADFYGHCVEHPGLTAALRDANVLVGPMRGEELREAVVKPAAREGLMVEPALAARVIQDAGTEPGALPLVSHALLETWRRRRGKTLTLAGYEAAGGVQGAIADTAEDVYRRLGESDRRALRRLLLRLVDVGEGGPDQGTRSPAPRSGFDGELVDRLTRARLLTVKGDDIEIAHEALIRTWPRLREWLAQDQEWLRFHRRLGAAAAEWDSMGRDDGSLYQGARLAMAVEWTTVRPGRLSATERAFLDASVTAQRAIEAAAERRTRVLKTLMAALSVLLLAAVAAGAAALDSRAEADEQRRVARSRQLAAEAAVLLPTDVTGAAGRAVRGYRTSPTLEARSALMSVAGRRPYQTRLRGHAGMVKAVAFRPDGAEVATGGQDGAVVVWSPDRRVQRGRLDAGGGAVRALEYSPDGRLLAAATLAGNVTVWRTADWARQGRMRVGGILDGLAFSPDGRRLATSGAAHRTVVWDSATGREIGVLRGHGGKRTEVAFTPDGDTLAIADEDGRAALWDPVDGDPPRMVEISDAALYAVAVSPDGRYLAAAGEDGQVYLRDLGNDEVLTMGPRVAHDDSIRALAFAGDGRTLVSAGYDEVAQLWDVRTRSNITRLSGHTGGLYDVAVSADGGRIATVASDQTTLIWDRRYMPFTGHTDWVNAVAFGAGGRSIVSAGQDGTVRWWDARSRRATASATAHEGGAATVDVGPDGTLATGGSDGVIRLWRDRRRLAALEGHQAGVRSLEFSPDGRRIAAADLDGGVIIWDVATRRQVTRLPHGRGLVGDVSFSPDGRLLATGGDDRAVTLWDTRTFARLATLPGHRGDVEDIAFSPDGRTLAAGGGAGQVVLWDVRGRRRAGTLTGHTAEVRAIDFDPSGRRLATAGLDGSIVVWDLSSRTKWAVLTGHTDVVLALDFSRDGRTLLSASGDHTIIPWPLDTRQAMATTQALSQD